MLGYATQQAALISLGRALFGDFDIEAILDNSPGYSMTIFFLLFMFVSIFILLSMFFAILGESQASSAAQPVIARVAQLTLASASPLLLQDSPVLTLSACSVHRHPLRPISATTSATIAKRPRKRARSCPQNTASLIRWPSRHVMESHGCFPSLRRR